MSVAAARSWIESELPDLLVRHRVPAAAVGVLQGGQVIDHAVGVLNLDTGVEATLCTAHTMSSASPAANPPAARPI